MPIVTLGGARIHYRRHGQGPLVVLLMGSGSSGRVWDLHQVPALVAAGYCAVTVDNRGIPPSEPASADLTLDDLVADTAALIRHLGEPAAVVGTSLGARIGQELALAHPELVRCAVLLAAHGRSGPVQAAWTEGRRALDDAGIELPARFRAAVTAVQNLSPRTLEDPERAEHWLQLFEQTPTRLSDGARAHLGLAGGDRLAAYREITVPCLVVGFADDQVLPSGLAREVADAIPGARYAEVAGCGHLGYLERPDEVNRLLLGFLAGHATPPPAGAPRPDPPDEEEPPTMAVNPFDDDDGTFHVVVNEEGQHALWPVFLDVPAGWETRFGPASRRACLEQVADRWTDQRPASLVALDPEPAP